MTLIADHNPDGSDMLQLNGSTIRRMAGQAWQLLAVLLVFLFASPLTAQEIDAKDFPTLLMERECSDCDFSGLPLQKQSLLGIVAQRSNFTGSNLSGSGLQRADLRGAALRNVNFTGANLTGARWDAADLSGAIFCNTTMPDGSLSKAECIEGTWKASFDGIAGGVLQISPASTPGYWEGTSEGRVVLRNIHRVGDRKYNAEQYLAISDDSHTVVSWLPTECKIDTSGMSCLNGSLTFVQISATSTIPPAVQFKLPEEAQYTIWVYMLEYNKDWGDGTVDKYLLKKARVFSGNRMQLNFNTAQITGHARWRTFSERGDAWGQPIRAALYKGTSNNPFANFIRKVESTTDNRGRFELDLPIQKNGGVEEERFRGKYILRQRVYQRPGDASHAPSGGDHDYTVVNTITDFEARRSDFLNWFTSEDHKQWLKNNRVGRNDINALNSLIRYATAPVTGQAELVEKAAKLYEKLSGKPLPGVTKKGADAKARRAAVKKLFWDRIRLFHQAQDSSFNR
jgi:hypothetical protein